MRRPGARRATLRSVPRLTRPLLAVTLAAALLAAGCGGDDDSSSGAAGGGSSSSAEAPSAPGQVTMKDIKFHPATITVKVGDKVTWTDEESVPHDVVDEATGLFKSKTFSKGQSFSYTPTKAGTIKYVCTLHPGMDGTIIVKAG